MRIGVGDEIVETSTGGGFSVVPKMVADFNAIEQLRVNKFNAALDTLRPLMPEPEITASSSGAVTVTPVEKKSSVTMVLLLAAAVGIGVLILTAKPVTARR